MKKLYESNDIKNIADAIRTKNNSELKYKVSEMSQAILDIPSGNIDNVVDGKWICPDDWDDVETIALPEVETEQVLYLVYRTDLPLSFANIRMSGAAYRYTIGHANNGQFIPIENSVNVSSGAWIKLFINDYNDYETSGKNTIVLKVEPQSANAKFTSWSIGDYDYNGTTLSQNYQTLVIRYGQLYYATSIQCQCRYLECDNIRFCKSLTTCNAVYSNCYNLKKHRHYGWDLSKCTTFTIMFNNCYVLCDIDSDFSNWVSEKCTNISSMFANCYMLSSELNMTGWNTQNVTTIASVFSLCYNVRSLIGVENWYLPKCGASSSAFRDCRNLKNNDDYILDLSNWHLSELSTSDNARDYMFSNCLCKKLIINNFNFTKSTNVSRMFEGCRLLETIDMRNIVPSTSKLTAMTAMFNECYSLHTILHDGDGMFYNWDLSKVTNMNTFMQRCVSLKELNFGSISSGAIVGSTANSTLTSMFASDVNLTMLDINAIDISNFTYNQLTGWLTACVKLVDFYPPKGINNNFTVSDCRQLSAESIHRIIENLVSSSTKHTLTLGTTLLAKVSDEDRQLATSKNWALA